MPIVETHGLTYRYGKAEALREVDFAVPRGALCALLGPNGAGKTTLLQVLMGLRRPTAGRVSVLGKDLAQLRAPDRSAIAYVAEGHPLPEWMTLDRLEAYLAPLYPAWDAGLAAELRRRFRLKGGRRIGTLSRGEKMKAALLCALAPRPRLLVLDEPFSGMDALVKDELVRGLLESAGSEGWTVLLCSHDIAELEMLADWVGILDGGRLILSEPADSLRARLKRVEVVAGNGALPLPTAPPPEWLSVERSEARVSLLVSDLGEEGAADRLRRWFPDPARIEVRPASLREIFVALVGRSPAPPHAEEVSR